MFIVCTVSATENAFFTWNYMVNKAHSDSNRWVKNLIFRYCTRVGSEKIIPRWEQDYQLQPLGKLGLFYEYLEMGKIEGTFCVRLHVCV